MTPTDLSALHRLCFKTPRPWNADEFSEFLKSPAVFLITRTNGFALGRIAGDELELLTLAVHPDTRRQGTAKELLSEFHITAQNQGAVQSFLEVSEENSAAIALYRTFGYKDAGYRKNYYASPKGPKTSALVMTCMLSPS